MQKDPGLGFRSKSFLKVNIAYNCYTLADYIKTYNVVLISGRNWYVYTQKNYTELSYSLKVGG